ncbi:DUF3530 family protein [Corallincola luteus]|uniref:DUF3530 family protein n=1 Tax=Corallincola luteus TaxID=1775177 RepID=A0ABY2APG8_9GAMM|nr:DUF3530 family protein [Corallincola luteus]TCI03651.1 DUF3530 family protein [Corallincola luteus]
MDNSAFHRLKRFIVTLPLIAFSLNAFAAPPADEATLARYDRDSELVPLGEPDNPFSALKLEALTPQTKGVVILVPDWGSQPDEQFGVGYLRRLLPSHGWVTLAITPPPVVDDENHVSPLDKADEMDPSRSAPDPLKPYQADEWLSEESRQQQIEAYKTALLQRMEATVKVSSQYPGFYLVIAQGSSAGWLAQLYAEEKLAPADAFVTIGAYLPEHQLNRTLATAMAKTSIPVLDLYSRYDNRWVQDTVTLRPQLANKYFKLHYRQRELFGDVAFSRSDERLWKEIYGWLTYLGW